MTKDKTNDIISRCSENFSGVSEQHISNSSSTKLSSNSEANEIGNLIGVIPSIKVKHFAQESDFDKFGRELVSQLYTLGDQPTENKAISVTAILNRLHDYQSQIENTALRMADNHTADCDNLMDWMDFAARLPVCSQSHRLSCEITDIKFVIRAARRMGDNMIFMFNSNRKQSSDVKQQILLLVYDAKKLLKEEFSYMQYEVYRIEDDISKFNALVNITVDGDTVQVATVRAKKILPSWRQPAGSAKSRSQFLSAYGGFRRSAHPSVWHAIYASRRELKAPPIDNGR